MKYRNRVFASILAAMLFVSACSKTGGQNTSSKKGDPQLEFSIENLKTLNGVKNVEKVEGLSGGASQGIGDLFANTDDYNLLLTFEQPLDWSDPSKGTFDQRVHICYSASRTANEFQVGGYMLSDSSFPLGSSIDGYASANKYNLIEVEYRYFGKSRPEGLSNTDSKYWDSLTSVNAAGDFHHILDELKKIIPGKWLMTGSSKGGVATMIQSMYYPEDADMFMAQIAPFMDGQQDNRFFKNLYETIGDEKYGKEQAAAYRKLVQDLQVEAIVNRDALQDKVYEYRKSHGGQYAKFTTPEILYEITVLDFATGVWQFEQNFDAIQAVLDLKGQDDYLDELLSLLLDPNGTSQNENVNQIEVDLSAYYVQCAKDLGYYKYDFSYLRDALAADGRDGKLVITEDMEDMLFYNLYLEPEVLNTLKYDPSVRNGILEWSQNTSSNVLLLYGGTDVWYSLRIPDVPDRDNFHTYVDVDSSHKGVITHLPWAQQEEIKKLMKDALT